VYIGLQAPQPFKWLFSRIPQALATVGWRILQVPRISSAPRSIFGFARQTARPSCMPGSRPPSPPSDHSPAAGSHSQPLSSGFPQVPPISSPGGSILGCPRQTGPPRAFRATSPPAFQLTTRLQPTTPPHWIQLESRRSHRCRAQGARFSVLCAKPAPLMYSGPQASQPFN
jgi:hypothetical protein